MDKAVIESAPSKYLSIGIDPVEAQTAYANMLSLLTFIGEKNATSRTRYPLGVAYRLIRQKVNKKMGYSWHNRKRGLLSQRSSDWRLHAGDSHDTQ